MNQPNFQTLQFQFQLALLNTLDTLNEIYLHGNSYIQALHAQ